MREACLHSTANQIPESLPCKWKTINQPGNEPQFAEKIERGKEEFAYRAQQQPGSKRGIQYLGYAALMNRPLVDESHDKSYQERSQHHTPDT